MSKISLRHTWTRSLISATAANRRRSTAVTVTASASETVEKVTGEPLKITEEPRRAGDPPELIAVAERVRSVLGWTPQFDDLETIVRTSLEWERKIAARDPSAYWAA